MDFERFKTINEERLNYKEMEDASVVSAYRNIGCGDGYRIYLKIGKDNSREKIIDASYTTTGCGFGVAALAMATEWVKGKSLAEAEKIDSQAIEKLFHFPPLRKNYPDSAVKAMQKALADYRNGTGIKKKDMISKTYALKKLKEQGHLRGENLKQIILDGENLNHVDMSKADLSNAFLQNTSFEYANLKGANLRGAFLNDSNLKGADLREADLRWCKLTGAKLDEAKLQGAVYDIGTRMNPKYGFFFKSMKKQGKKTYLTKLGTKSETKPGTKSRTMSGSQSLLRK